MKNNLIPLFLLTLMACSKAPINESKLRTVASLPESGKYFEDVTDESGVPSSIKGSTVIIGDYDNDGWPDVIVGGRLLKNVSNRDQIRFRDVTDQVNLSSIKGNPVFLDFNNDGELDVLTTTGQVFEQHHGKFSEVSEKMHFKVPEGVHTISFGDVNKDGWPDLILGMNEKHENEQFTFVPPHLYLNLKGKSFIEVSTNSNLQKFSAYTRGIVWSDFNNDGTPDVFFANYRLHENYLFKAKAGRLEDVSDIYKVKGTNDPKKFYDETNKAYYGPRYGHTIGAVWADFDNDGNFDLWTSNLVHKFVGNSATGYDIRGYVCDDSKIYKNMGAPNYKMVDMRSQLGIPYKVMGDWTKYNGDELWSQTTAADFDNDGFVDVYVSQVYNLKYAYSLLFKNLGGFKFLDVGANEPIRTFDSYGAAFGDFNNDGKMDLITLGRPGVDIPAKLRVFKNIYQTSNHYLKLRLLGTLSGKNPVTTKVKIVHDQGVFVKQYEGVTGTMNQQNDPTLHFGLGKITKIKHIEITWSSGKRQILTQVLPDKTYIAKEPIL